MYSKICTRNSFYNVRCSNRGGVVSVSVRVASFDKSAYRIAPSADCREQQIYTITGYWSVIEVSLVRCLRNKLSFDRNRSKYNKLLVKHNSTDCGVTYCRNSIYHMVIPSVFRARNWIRSQIAVWTSWIQHLTKSRAKPRERTTGPKNKIGRGEASSHRQVR